MDYEFAELYQHIVPHYAKPREKVAFVIGRFQPFHKGHLALIEEAFKYADKVIVMIGSVQESRVERNPYSYDERRGMIKASVSKNLIVEPLPDYPKQEDWLSHITNILNNNSLYGSTNTDYFFISCDKDESTLESNNLLIDLLPTLTVIKHKQLKVIHATDIRKQLFEDGIPPFHIDDLPIKTRYILSVLNIVPIDPKLHYNA